MSATKRDNSELDRIALVQEALAIAAALNHAADLAEKAGHTVKADENRDLAFAWNEIASAARKQSMEYAA
jgi:hypothetical protein